MDFRHVTKHNVRNDGHVPSETVDLHIAMVCVNHIMIGIKLYIRYSFQLKCDQARLH